MIKIDKNYISFEGDQLQLNLELGVIMRAFYKKGVINREMLDNLVKGTVMTDDELAEEAKKSKEKLIKHLDENMRDLHELQKLLQSLYGKGDSNEET